MKDFTNLYSLSKTLRFELRPVNETANFIEDFKQQGIIDTVSRDKQRVEEYKKLKKILDQYHRDFIEDTFNNATIPSQTFADAFQQYQLSKKQGASDSDKNAFEKSQTEIRKSIAKLFTENNKTWFVTGKYKDLLNGKQESVLYKWYEKHCKGENKTGVDFEEGYQAIFAFDKFSTYFTGFDENRKNMYTDKNQSTAIAYRIANENMIKHFDNCLRFAKVKKDFPDFYEQIREYEGCFTPEAFNQFLNQKGIDRYNYQYIGRPAEEENTSRINMLGNKYNQDKQLKGKDRVPKFTRLFKQILSDRESLVQIDEFADDGEMLQAVKQVAEDVLFTCDEKGKTIFNRVDDLLAEYMQKDFIDSIYLRKPAISNLSGRIWGGQKWGRLSEAISAWAEKNISAIGKREAYCKREAYNISELQQAIDEYIPTLEEVEENVCLLKKMGNTGYYTRNMAEQDEGKSYQEVIAGRYEKAKPILAIEGMGGGKQREENLTAIKDFLDAVLDFEHFLKDLDLKQKQRDKIEGLNADFYDSLAALHKEIRAFVPLYNKTRNYATKKPYSTEKFKINFDKPTLLDGWDVNKETSNLSIILLKDGRYYLGIINNKNTGIFDYQVSGEENKKKLEHKLQLREDALAKGSESCYRKMVYKLLPGASKMLPKVFFAKSNIKYFDPSDYILKVRQDGLFKKEADDKDALVAWIDFMKCSIKKHSDWSKSFKFNFMDARDYKDISEFYADVEKQGYNITFDNIKSSYISEKVAAGELFLFEIYNKDFSPYSKGRPNMHTLYWKSLFEEENLKDVVAKLNGQAEIFFRPYSIKRKDVVIHRANQSIENKNPLNDKKQSNFEYDIVKDRRYSVDKFMFHCPITLNFKSSTQYQFNQQVNKYLNDNPDIKIIGIDRGERHLLYYSLIDQQGNIKEQGSLNTIGETGQIQTNYQSLLHAKEEERAEARESWKTIENIKELKAGYLSHVVHKLASLMVHNNAIVVLEDLNFGFKRGRFAVEKQVYQKFEKALIDKLNYLVFKDIQSKEEPGHYLNAYQLTSPFKSFEKLGKQSGFLFYVPAWNTSKIDPITGFVDLVKPKYENQAKAKDFIEKIDNIKYNSGKNYFEFAFDYSNFSDRAGERKDWLVCTSGNERYSYEPKIKKTVRQNVTENLATLFNEKGINFEDGQCLIEEILKVDDASFFKSLIFNLKLTLQLRHTHKDGNREIDYILSPVAAGDGTFFDSRKVVEAGIDSLPKDADANGAYHIALKGLMTLKRIGDDGTVERHNPGELNKDWLDFAQQKPFRD